MLADSRTNSVIIRAPTTARANLARTLIAKLDKPTLVPGNVHVVYLRNAEATKLAQVLRAVMASEYGASAASMTQGIANQPMAQAATQAVMQQSSNSPPPSSPTPMQGPLSTGGATGFIQADPTTNTLIITANESAPITRVLQSPVIGMTTFVVRSARFNLSKMFFCRRSIRLLYLRCSKVDLLAAIYCSVILMSLSVGPCQSLLHRRQDHRRRLRNQVHR